MKKRMIIRILSIIIAIALPVGSCIVAFAGSSGESGGSSASNSSKYQSPDINQLTGHGEEPEEISVSAGATYQEKAWYEYVPYSEKAVSSYRLNDDHRILFYDPYTYTNSMIMDVQFDAKTNEFDTMSSYTISHTTQKSMTAGLTSTETSTVATQTSGRDVTHTEVKNGGSTKTTYNHSTTNKVQGKVTDDTYYYYDLYSTINESFATNTKLESATAIGGTDILKETVTIGGGATTTTNFNEAWLTDWVTKDTTYSNDYKTTTTFEGSDTVENNTSSVTDGWTELSARVTKTLGSSTSTSNSWSETEGTTITKTYAATHFASDGVTPLPWAIVHYSVQMPMKCCLQVKYSGEWVTISTIYCLLTTVKGTCRAWMQNGQTYYEDWGNGEPVVATDFWSQFMTREQLMKAYSDKLYPVGGED